jgi:hypothetical protein
MAMSDKSPAPTSPRHRLAGRRPALPRVAFSVAEAAKMLGRRPDALRRQIERQALVEGDEKVAKLIAGIVARKKKDGGRWFIIVPPMLLNTLAAEFPEDMSPPSVARKHWDG